MVFYLFSQKRGPSTINAVLMFHLNDFMVRHDDDIFLDKIDIGHDNGKILLFTFHWIHSKADCRTVNSYFSLLFR